MKVEIKATSRPVSITHLSKLASSQPENERKKQSCGPRPRADDRRRKGRLELQRQGSRASWLSESWKKGEHRALDFLGLKAAEKREQGETPH